MEEEAFGIKSNACIMFLPLKEDYICLLLRNQIKNIWEELWTARKSFKL